MNYHNTTTAYKNRMIRTVLKSKKCMERIKGDIHDAYCEWMHDYANDIAREGFKGWYQLTDRQLILEWLNIFGDGDNDESKAHDLGVLLSGCE